MQRLIHHGKRVARITSGVIVLILGIILSVPGIPGPGLLLVFLGLSILAVDFVWAHRLKKKIQHETDRVVRKIRGQPKADAPVEKT